MTQERTDEDVVRAALFACNHDHQIWPSNEFVPLDCAAAGCSHPCFRCLALAAFDRLLARQKELERRGLLRTGNLLDENHAQLSFRLRAAEERIEKLRDALTLAADGIEMLGQDASRFRAALAAPISPEEPEGAE